MPSMLHILVRFIFSIAVYYYTFQRFVKSCLQYKNHHVGRSGKLYEEDNESDELSNETLVWNKMMRRRTVNSSSVSIYREESRVLNQYLYPNLDDSWFGCAEKVEKIEKLRDSYWISLKNCKRREKVMLFIHGGGFISGHPLGIDAKSVVYGIEEVNKHSEIKCSHVLSVEYRLAEDPSHYSTMDTRLLTTNLTDQLQDCYDCFRYLIEEKGISAQDIILSGHSAGACHSAMLAFKLMTGGDSRMWPVHSIALYSPPCDVSTRIITEDHWKEENVVILTNGMLGLIDTCVTQEEKIKFSLLENIHQLESQDVRFYDNLFKSKWIINYSHHEELAPGNEYLVKLLSSKAVGRYEKQLVVITENYQIHCYPVASCLLPESRRSNISILDEALNHTTNSLKAIDNI